MLHVCRITIKTLSSDVEQSTTTNVRYVNPRVFQCSVSYFSRHACIIIYRCPSLMYNYLYVCLDVTCPKFRPDQNSDQIKIYMTKNHISGTHWLTVPKFCMMIAIDDITCRGEGHRQKVKVYLPMTVIPSNVKCNLKALSWASVNIGKWPDVHGLLWLLSKNYWNWCLYFP